MSLNVCPAANVAAPLEVVWEMAQPGHFSEWIDGQVERITPGGPAVVGQRITLQSKAFGRNWRVSFTVTSVDPGKHQLGLQGEFPLGISMIEHISCARLDATGCRLQYG
ncbi:MAG: SRPBCC family protein [Anaerolineaceae bacterium]|nr:SRPBCC family protein [Anaerolineaceae bacterium]